MLTGRHFSYAIYTDESRLVIDPRTALAAAMDRQSRSGRPISGVYILSHGWNCTIPESVASYHSYMEVIDGHFNSQHQAEPWRTMD
jgi:hypothetical protein